MAVLLEEHPAQRLRAQPGIGRKVRTVLGQIAEDGIRFDQDAAVFQLQHRHLAVGVLSQIFRRACRALRAVDLHPTVLVPELFQQQA
jgi:hypothetical protein